MKLIKISFCACLMFLFFGPSYAFAQKSQLSLSCLFQWKDMVQNVTQVKIAPEIQNSPTYPFKNPKEFYGNLPDKCLSKLKISSKLLHIIMDGDDLMKIVIILKGGKNPSLIQYFEQEEQNRIDHDFTEDGIAISNLLVQLDKAYVFEYTLELYGDDKFKEELVYRSNKMSEYE